MIKVVVLLGGVMDILWKRKGEIIWRSIEMRDYFMVWEELN